MTGLPIKAFFQGLFLILLALLLLDNNRMKQQNDRLEKDISGLSVALNTYVDTTRNSLGQMQAKTATIVLSQEQTNEILKAETKSIKERFDVRIKDLKSFAQVGSKYTLPIYVMGKDTVIYNNTEKVYYTPQGTLYTKGDSLLGSVSISDTIRIAVSKGKREHWWKIWKKRPLVTNAFMSNPDGSITSLKSVLSE